MTDKSVRSKEIRTTIRQYLLEEVIPGENPSALGDSMELISSGILDSISTARLVTFLENRFDVRFKASEVSAAYLNSVDLMVGTVESKLE
jgi:acyl carrier protein